MKKTIKLFMSFLMWAFVAGMIGNEAPKMGLQPIVAETVFLIVTVLVVLRARSNPNPDAKSDVAVELWVNYIIERLWKNNRFLDYAWSDDDKVLMGKIVHIPQPGAQPTIRKNNASYPVATVQRTDTDITYTLDNYTTDPDHIPDVDLAVISYDKTMSIIEDQYGYLLQGIADDILYKWLNGMTGNATNIVQTSGAATAATITGQAGNRQAMVAADLQQARLKLNKMNVSPEGRYALIQSDMLQQMVDSLSVTQYRDFSRAYDEKSGTIGQLYGFNIIERSTTATVQAALDGSSDLQANDFQTAVGATDNVACICWQQNAVARALGERKMFQSVGDPRYYGDIYSMLVRMGGRRRRADDAGIVAILQSAA